MGKELVFICNRRPYRDLQKAISAISNGALQQFALSRHSPKWAQPRSFLTVDQKQAARVLKKKQMATEEERVGRAESENEEMCGQRDRGTEGQVSPVGQRLEGSVHVAGVPDVLQPRQAWGTQRHTEEIKTSHSSNPCECDGSREPFTLVRQAFPFLD